MVHSSWITELQISSRDGVSISPSRVSISPSDRLEFVGDQFRFRKSSPRWRIIGREEIEEIEEGSTEIGRQRSKMAH